MTSKKQTGDSIGLKDAAALLGLSDDLLTWALEEHLLVGSKDKSGRWSLSRGQLETGQLPLHEQFAQGLPEEQRGPQSADESPLETPSRAQPHHLDTEKADSMPERHAANADLSATPPPRDPPRTETPNASLDEELRFLRQLIEDQNRRLGDKDQVVTELARSIASLAEEALNRGRS